MQEIPIDHTKNVGKVVMVYNKITKSSNNICVQLVQQYRNAYVTLDNLSIAYGQKISSTLPILTIQKQCTHVAKHNTVCNIEKNTNLVVLGSRRARISPAKNQTSRM